MCSNTSEKKGEMDRIELLSIAVFESSIGKDPISEDLNLFILASDLIYECNFKLAWWHRVFFPILSHRVSKHQHLIRISRSDSSIEDQLRIDVSTLEFRDKAPPILYLVPVRASILKNKLTHWQVRQAFNSKSISRRDQQLVISVPPKLRSTLARVLQYPLAAAAFYFALSVAQLGIFMGADELLLLDFSIVGALLCHQIGGQWIHGFKVLQQIWPSAHPLSLP